MGAIAIVIKAVKRLQSQTNLVNGHKIRLSLIEVMSTSASESEQGLAVRGQGSANRRFRHAGGMKGFLFAFIEGSEIILTCIYMLLSETL